MSTILSQLDKHIVLTHSDEVLEICQPLFDEFNFNYFDNTRTYPDGTFTSLTSDPKWFRHFFEKSYHISSTVVPTGIHYWCTHQCHEAVDDAEKFFDHCHGIVICKQYDDYLEFFSFAAPKSNTSILSFYLNNMNVLEQFCCYFQEKASHLIAMANKQRIKIPMEMKGVEQDDISDKIKLFLDRIKVRRYRFSHMQEDMYITGREMQALLLVAQGKSTKEVASAMGISPRTVECYIDGAKIKLGSYSKSHLLSLIHETFPHLVLGNRKN